MKRIKITIVYIIVNLLSFSAQAQSNILCSGKAVRAGGEKGVSPLSFPMCYSAFPHGYAFTKDSNYPDFFFMPDGGLPENKGIFVCKFETILEDGKLVYSAPERINHPWGEKLPPNIFRIIQFGKNIYAIWLSKNSLIVTKYNNETNSFEKEFQSSVVGIEMPVISFDITPIDDNTAEFAILCSDGKRYRPETFDGDTQSLYDGAEMFRGEITRSGIFLTAFDTKMWKQTRSVVQITDLDLMIDASDITCVRSSDDVLNGYIIVNGQGSMKYIDRRAPKDTKYVMSNAKKILIHPSHSARITSFPISAGNTPDNFIIGGEGAICNYRFTGRMAANGAPIFTEPEKVMQFNGELYSGSLCVPTVVDWNCDGALDIISGNSEGRLLFFKNFGNNLNPDFRLPEEMYSAGEKIVFRPGYHTVQGPYEAAWGYLCPTVFDWNKDGLQDIIFSGSRSKFEVMFNTGTGTNPQLSAPKALSIDNLELWGTWRVRPAVAKINDNNVIVIMDEDNALHMYYQVDDLNVEDGGRLLMTNGLPITGHNNDIKDLGMGQRGRGKLFFTDWDGDGNLDLLIGTIKRSAYPYPERGIPFIRQRNKMIGLQVLLLRNAGTNEKMVFDEPVQFQFKGEDYYLGAHSNAPAPCMLGDISKGVNLLVGVESGKFFFFNHDDLTSIGIPK